MSLFESFGQFGWLFLLAVLVIIVLIKTAVVVPNQSAYVVERLGKFHKVLYAGFHLLLPFGGLQTQPQGAGSGRAQTDLHHPRQRQRGH